MSSIIIDTSDIDPEERISLAIEALTAAITNDSSIATEEGKLAQKALLVLTEALIYDAPEADPVPDYIP